MSSKLDHRHEEEMVELKKLQARRTKASVKRRFKVQEDIDRFFLGKGERRK